MGGSRRAAKRDASFCLGVPQPDGSAHELQCSVLPYKLLVAGVRHELVGPHLQPLLSLLYFPTNVRPRFVAYSQTDGDVTVLVDEASGAALDGLAPALSGSPLPYCAIEVFEGSSALNMTGEPGEAGRGGAGWGALLRCPCAACTRVLAA